MSRPLTALPEGWSHRTIHSIQRRLLKWFDLHQRVLPWRIDRDPYRIWVSEVMLQQTTVAAVLRHYPRFLERFPTVEDLAAADESDVFKAWEGLGYYRRAKSLHQTARLITSRHNAEFPNDPEEWARFPGVGRYILGAVLSQAFEVRLPIVEANSLRLLSRLFGFEGDPRTGVGTKWVWRAAEQLLPSQRIGDFNQALMEIGSLVCKPKDPLCQECPLANVCVAHCQGRENDIPPLKKRPATSRLREVAIAIRKSSKYLVGLRNSEQSRWANLWECPHGLWQPDESLEQAARRVAGELTGLSIGNIEPLKVVKHTITRYAIEMTAVVALARSGKLQCRDYSEIRWVSSDELIGLPTSTPQRKLFEALQAKTDTT